MSRFRTTWIWVAFGSFLAVLGAMSTEVQAAVLYADGSTVSELEDEDWEVLIEQGQADNILQVGELIAGVLKIQDLNDASPGTKPSISYATQPDTFTSVFLLQVASVTGGNAVANGSATDIQFAAATQAQWDTTFGTGGVIDLGMGAVPLPGLAAGTMALVYDGVPYATANGQTGASMGASASTFLSGGNLLYELGITGAGPQEFWSTLGTDAEHSLLVNTTKPTNRFALNVTALHAGIPLLPHNYLLTQGDFTFTGATDVQMFGGFQPAGGSSPWPIGTDSNLYVVAVPEPGSLAIMGLFACIFGCVAVRRNSRK